MTEQLQKELPHFFNRISIDSEQEFNTWAKAIVDSAAKDPASTQTKSPAPATQPPPTRKRAPAALAIKPTIERTPTPAQRAPAALAIKPTIERTPTPAARQPQLPMPPSSLVEPHDRMTVAYPVAAPTGTPPQPSAPTALDNAAKDAPHVSVRAARDDFLARLAQAKGVDPVDSTISTAQKAQDIASMSDATKEAHDKLWNRLRRNPNMPTAATTIPGYLETESAAPSKTGASNDATTAAASVTPNARGSHDPFKERVAPLDEMVIDDSVSKYESPTDENDEDDIDLPMMTEEREDEGQKNFSKWFGNAPGAENALP